MKKICVITSTRAEYGLFKNFLYLLKKDKNFHLDIIVTGTHFKKSLETLSKKLRKMDIETL